MFELIIKVTLIVSLITSHILLTGACLESHVNETIESFCKRVRDGNHCKIPTDCKKVIKPTDGCCPICGKTHSMLWPYTRFAKRDQAEALKFVAKHFPIIKIK